MSDLTIVVELPQPLDKVTRLLQALAVEWPAVKVNFVGGTIRIPRVPDEVDEVQT